VQPLPSITGLRSKADQAVALRRAAERRLKDAKAEVKNLENREDLLRLVAELFRTLLDREVTMGVKAVEDLQSRGLQSVFSDQDLSVEAKVGIQRGKVSVDLTTTERKSDGVVIKDDSITGFGGSVTTVQSVLFRIIVILRRGLRPLMLLDEALPAFDPKYSVNVGEFLKALCKRTGLDILLVTHNLALAESVENSYRIVRRPTGSTFERLR